MTVAQLLAVLAKMPGEAVVLMEGDGGLSLVFAAELIDARAGAPAEVILLPSMAE